MQTTGHRIGVRVELAAGVQLRHDDVDGRHPGGVHGDRNPAAVVGDLDAAVLEQPDVDLAGVAGHRLVHGVVHHFPDEVVQTALTGGADIHARTFADGLQPLENRDGLGAVLLLCFLLRSSHGRKLPYFLMGVGLWRYSLPPASHVIILPSDVDRTDSEAAFLHTYSRRLWNFSDEDRS